MKLRDGDQPLPVVRDVPDCQESLLTRLVRDIPDRRQVGISRYGTGLKPLNGRDVQRDAYEEWLDLGTYLEQWRRERDQVLDYLRLVAGQALSPDEIEDDARALLNQMGIPA